MEITFNELKDKEIVNLYDGKKLGRAIDITFDSVNGAVLGLVVPGEHKIFRKSEDIFIPISNIKKLGEDVVLVKLSPDEPVRENLQSQRVNYRPNNRTVYARYKRVVEKEN